MDEPRRSGLREARRDRGWTQEEAADQLARLAWVRRSERVGVNADMIAKWERGEKNPSIRYRELLCLLYGATPEYLGIARLTKNRTSTSPGPRSARPTSMAAGVVPSGAPPVASTEVARRSADTINGGGCPMVTYSTAPGP